MHTSPTIFEPGRNCWRVERAHRLAFLVDGAAYFSAFRAAVEKAQRRIIVLAWDINSRLDLNQGDSQPGTGSCQLGAFLNRVVASRPSLHAYILDWDYTMLYAMDREWLPVYKLGLSTHRRLHFQLDDRHPPSASQHQKIVVIDDELAFIGGLDLTHHRWDTPEHLPDDPRRVDATGKRYQPFHDIQAVFDGPAAAALGELARERWYRATGERLRPASDGSSTDKWPALVAPEFTDIDVAIARTEPPFDARPGIQEVKQLYLDAIASARRSIYIENQYLTSPAIRDALAARLMQPDGPEVVVVTPRQTSGWLSRYTMDVLRARLANRLRAIDRSGHLRICYPDIAGLSQNINVHAKLMIVDDALVRVGSANLNNRSMALDSECDIAIEARGNPEVAQAIAALRNRLLGEHLGVPARTVAELTGQTGSLIAAVDTLHGPHRMLKRLEIEVPKDIDALIPDIETLDPERPIDADLLAAELVPAEVRIPVWRRLLFILLILSIPLALAAAWRWTPLSELLDVAALVEQVKMFEDHPAAGLIVVAVFVVAGLVAAPVTVLMFVTILVFGPALGFVYALGGAIASAMVTYGLGHVLGRHLVHRITGSRINRVRRRLQRKGIFAVIIARVLPLAPFTVVNMVAGASRIRFRHFVLGSVIGMIPGTLLMAVLVDRASAVFEAPGFGTVAWFAVSCAAVFAGILLIRRWLHRRAGEADRQLGTLPS